MEYHNPVLLNECIEGLNIKPTGIYVYVTFGGGGHSKLILEKLKGGKVFAFDQDEKTKENDFKNEGFKMRAHLGPLGRGIYARYKYRSGVFGGKVEAGSIYPMGGIAAYGDVIVKFKINTYVTETKQKHLLNAL